MRFIAWHLGLGDAIACAAIIAKLAKTGEEIFIPCWDHNKISVESFFINYPNVKVVSESDKKNFKPEGECETVMLGVYNKDLPQLPDEDFVQWFYRGAGMTMEEKEEHCPIKEASLKVKQIVPYGARVIDSFIHEDIQRSFIIDRGKVREGKFFCPVNYKQSILQYSKALLSVSEVHCIDSSFLHLSEALSVPGKKVYHKYARPESTEYNYLKGWETL